MGGLSPPVGGLLQNPALLSLSRCLSQHTHIFCYHSRHSFCHVRLSNLYNKQSRRLGVPSCPHRSLHILAGRQVIHESRTNHFEDHLLISLAAADSSFAHCLSGRWGVVRSKEKLLLPRKGRASSCCLSWTASASCCPESQRLQGLFFFCHHLIPCLLCRLAGGRGQGEKEGTAVGGKPLCQGSLPTWSWF